MRSLPALKQATVQDCTLFVDPTTHIVSRFSKVVLGRLMGVLHTNGVSKVHNQRLDARGCLMSVIIAVILIQKKTQSANGTLQKMERGQSPDMLTTQILGFQVQEQLPVSKHLLLAEQAPQADV